MTILLPLNQESVQLQSGGKLSSNTASGRAGQSFSDFFKSNQSALHSSNSKLESTEISEVATEELTPKNVGDRVNPSSFDGLRLATPAFVKIGEILNAQQAHVPGERELDLTHLDSLNELALEGSFDTLPLTQSEIEDSVSHLKDFFLALEAGNPETGLTDGNIGNIEVLPVETLTRYFSLEQESSVSESSDDLAVWMGGVEGGINARIQSAITLQANPQGINGGDTFAGMAQFKIPNDAAGIDLAFSENDAELLFDKELKVAIQTKTVTQNSEFTLPTNGLLVKNLSNKEVGGKLEGSSLLEGSLMQIQSSVKEHVNTSFEPQNWQTAVAQSNVTARVQMPINIHFSQPQWAEAIAERSAMMASQKIEFAEIQLDPPELGHLQVKVHVNQDQQASVSFISSNTAVRDALEQTSYRLRELFGEQSVDLLDVDVSDQEQGQKFTNQDNGSKLFSSGDEEFGLDDTSPAQQLIASYGVDSYV